MSAMTFWRLESYKGQPAKDATPVGTIVRLHSGVSPAEFDGGALATHFNRETGNWVAARWFECGDPKAADA